MHAETDVASDQSRGTDRDRAAATPLESEYKRLSPTPDAFPTVVGKLRLLDQSNYDMSDDAIRGIRGKTMFVVGDADGVQLEHAIELFTLRGGGDRKVALQGFMTQSPQTRLLILPGTTHIGIMANAEHIAQLAVPFLEPGEGPDLIIQGSSTLYPQLLAQGLIDQLTLMTFPVILGTGKRLFGDRTPSGTMRMVGHEVTPGGNIIATYEPKGDVQIGILPSLAPSKPELERRKKMDAGTW